MFGSLNLNPFSHFKYGTEEAEAMGWSYPLPADCAADTAVLEASGSFLQ